MPSQIGQADLAREVLDILDETFEHHHGIYLDRGTSLLETLATIDHRQASIPVGGRCATLAAQVAHVTYYLEVLEHDLLGQEVGKVDWTEIWRSVGAVDADEWDRLRADLDRTYRRFLAGLRAVETWQADPHLSVALAVTVHTAYHLGELRQALCVVGPSATTGA